MSVLTRLVARATGQAAPGLTPRLPGRFETGGGGAEPVEVHERAVVAPARAPEAARPETPSVHQAPQREGQASVPGEARASAQAPDRPAPEPPEPLAPRIQAPERAVAEPRERPEPAELTVTANATRETAIDPEAPPPLLAPQTAQAAPERRPTSRQDAPEVLLPDAPPPDARAARQSEPDGAMMPLFHAAPVTRARQAPAPEPPEITVHIGRIDVVMAPEERKGAKRPEPRRPQMTDLGDYLRGRESGR